MQAHGINEELKKHQRQKFEDSLVYKLIILRITQNTKKTYDSVKELWSAINIDVNGTVTTDIKLANIIVGTMSHAILYPYTW